MADPISDLSNQINAGMTVLSTQFKELNANFAKNMSMAMSGFQQLATPPPLPFLQGGAMRLDLGVSGAEGTGWLNQKNIW